MQQYYPTSMRQVAVSLLLIVLIAWTTISPSVIVVAEPPWPAATAGDDRYGINFVNSVDVNTLPTATVNLRYQQASTAGARWTRWPMYWQDIEQTLGVRNYSAQEAVLNRDVANGLQPHIILMGTPSWAATSGSPAAPFPKVGERSFNPQITPLGVQHSTVIAPPRYLDRPWNDPSNYWGQFVYKTVSRFKDRVKVWELWNEPDFNIFWSGTERDYYLLLKVGYQAAKAADPTSTVLFAGLSFWHNQSFFPRVLDYVAADRDAMGQSFFFDALPWHPYIDPYYIYDWAQGSRTQMQAKLGTVKPVWVNETNVPVCGNGWATSCSPTDWYRATMDEQAAYVIQAYAYAFAANVQKLSIFQMWDDGLVVDDDYYGLAANSGATRPSYTAYQVAATYLAKPTQVTRSPGSGYEMIIMDGTPQGRATVVWATQGSDIQINMPASATSARLISQNGATTTIVPSGGAYRLTLPRATNNRDLDTGRYIIGGKPYILVESYVPPVIFSGRVTDNRGISLMGATVNAGSYVTGVDINGNFRLPVTPGAYDVSASLSSFGLIPSRNLSVTEATTYNFVLPPADNYVQNWGFEGGISQWWTPSGRVAESVEWMHSGAKSAKLGEWNNVEDGALTQGGITVPPATYRPTVSFFYAVPTAAGPGDAFFLDVTSAGGTVSHPLSLNTQGTWAHKWFELSNVSGPITLSFRLTKANTSPNNLRVFLDEVSVGKGTGGPNIIRFPMLPKG